MFLQPIQCGAELGGGRQCREVAHVIDTKITYQEDFEEGKFEQLLDEVQNTMECQKCGKWTRITTVHANHTFATT